MNQDPVSATPRQRLLVVDESRMVRALLGKVLREHYDVREEADGEAAWQVLVLDQSVGAVVCSLNLPVLSGDGLLVRLRSSRLQRRARMPMLMVTGDDESAIVNARNHGASDFIARTAQGAELLTRVGTLLALAQSQRELQENLEQNVQNPETGLFTRKYIELQAAQALSQAMRQGGEVSAIVLGFDNVGALRETYGDELVAQLQQRFITMLGGKIRREDSLGHYAGSQLVVVSPGTPFPACASFGDRLREAIRGANISARGQRLNLSVSVGVSNSPADEVVSAGKLIELAAERLRQAQQAGGNRVVACRNDTDATAVVDRSPGIARALELLRTGQEAALLPHLPALIGQLMPVLRLLERECHLGLPLAELERRSTDPAHRGEDAGQS